MSLDVDVPLERPYGPFRGFVDSVERHMVPLDAITGDSLDVLVSPDVGKLIRRGGASRVGATTGVLEMAVAAASMSGMQLWEFASPCLSDGYPTHAVLFADESRGFGQVYIRDTDGPTDYTLGEEFSATHYPTAASTVGNMKVVPIPYEGGGATGYTRLVTEPDRRRPMAGARNRVGMQDMEVFPGHTAVPSIWNRCYNRASGSGTQKLRLKPAGHFPPLHMGSVPAASYPARSTTVGPWKEGDTFFRAVVFKHFDGSYSMPSIPRDRDGTYAGYGLTVVNDNGDATVEYFPTIPWRDIPVGDWTVKERILCRSNKKSKIAVAAGEWPDPSGLFVCGVLEDNVSTSYDDPRGDDGTLIDDANVISFFHRWPERAKYAWTFDQRVGFGHLRPNPCALIVAPTGSAVSLDLNAGDDSVLIHGSQGFLVRVTKSTAGAMALELRTVAIAGVPTTTTITLSATKKLQAVIDEINATVVAGAGREWRSQNVPGMSLNTPSDQLAPTSQQVGNCTAGSGTTTVTSTNNDAFLDVAHGHRIRGHANIPAGAYVISVDRTTNKSMVISAATTGAVPAATTFTFHVDVGDDALATDSTYGNMRAYGGSYPVVLALKQYWLDNAYPDSPQGIGFTAGGPAHAPYAGESWVTSVANRKEIPTDAGVFMGAAPLNDGCVLFYSKWRGLLKNKRAGNTGEDADYRLEFPWRDGGAISPASIVSGNGWAGCLTPNGYWLTDGERQAYISTDIFNPAQVATAVGKGSLANEVALCAAQALKDGTAYGFRAHVRAGVLHIAWRTSAAGGTVANRLQRYDFSPSVEATGLAQVLRPDGSPYGWSPPLTYCTSGFTATARAGVIGSVQKSGGVQLLTVDDTNDGTTCGLVTRFEDGTYLDGADAVVEQFYCRLDDHDVAAKVIAHKLHVKYRLSGGASDTATVTIYANQLRTGGKTRTLDLTPAAVQHTRKPLELPQDARGAATHHEVMIRGDTSVTRTTTEYFSMTLECEVCDDDR